MRTLTRTLIAGAAAVAFVGLPATASAATPDWCSDTTNGAPCTVAPTGGDAQAATTDGWCLIPGTDICRRY